jgi:hypothetical protein
MSELEHQLHFIERTCQVEFYHIQNHATFSSAMVFRGGGVQVSVPPQQVMEAANEWGWCLNDAAGIMFVTEYGIGLLREEIERTYA